MAQAQENLYEIGTDGQWTTRNPGDPLVNAPENALTESLNTRFGDHPTLRRRGGSRDSFYNPTDGTRIIHRDICGDVTATYQDIIDYNQGVRGAGRFGYVDNRDIKSGFDLEYYTLFAGQSVPSNGPFPQTHTFTWRNKTSPQINKLELPSLPRPLYPDAFKDVNIYGYSRAAWWNYVSWPWGGDRETFLIGSCGGRRNRPGGDPVNGWAEPPEHWAKVCHGSGSGTGRGTGVGTGSPQYSITDRQCYQRRAMFWSPTWGEWLEDIWGGAPPNVSTIGPYYWEAPFIWYWESPNDPGGGDPTHYYFEPCGRFLEVFNGSLFMARIERTVMRAGVPTWEYKPSYIMWSWQNYPTAMGFGTPATYPFYCPDEPGKRPWWDIRETGTRNARTAYFRADSEPIVGMTKWAKRLFIMKSNGFMEISGTYHGDFYPQDFKWTSQGPCGPYAWTKNAPEGIYYATRDGLFLFDGNPASYNQNLASPKVRDIFNNHIDWGSAREHTEGETISIVCFYDPNHREVIINFPKVGEQGAGTNLPAGTPTHQLVFDTLGGRFTEWGIRLPYDNYTVPVKTSVPVAPGLIVAGERPIEEGYVLYTHPIGGNGGRLLFQADVGNRDAMEMLPNGDDDTSTGYSIPLNVHTKDFLFEELKPKIAINIHRQIVFVPKTYTGVIDKIKRRIIYDYTRTYTSDDVENPEMALLFDDSGKWIHESEITHKDKFIVLSVGWFHDEVDLNIGRLILPGITTAPLVGETVTQASTGAELFILTSSLNTTTHVLTLTGYFRDPVGFDTTNSAISLPTMNPNNAIPTSFTVIANPYNDNPNADIIFMHHGLEFHRSDGDARML